MRMKKYELAIMKAYKRDSQNLYKSIKTTCNKRAVCKIEVAGWQVMVRIFASWRA